MLCVPTQFASAWTWVCLWHVSAAVCGSPQTHMRQRALAAKHTRQQHAVRGHVLVAMVWPFQQKASLKSISVPYANETGIPSKEPQPICDQPG